MTKYPIEIKVKNSATKEEKTYHLRQCSAFEDDSLVVQMQDPKGKPNDKEIWIARLVRDIEEITDEIARKMPRWEWETLCLQWKRYNEVDMSSFLEVEETNKNQDSDSSSQ